ncbi:MAG: immunoglobulin domain-containing protein, partial [Verrucomicrobiota bacterium]
VGVNDKNEVIICGRTLSLGFLGPGPSESFLGRFTSQGEVVFLKRCDPQLNYFTIGDLSITAGKNSIVCAANFGEWIDIAGASRGRGAIASYDHDGNLLWYFTVTGFENHAGVYRITAKNGAFYILGSGGGNRAQIGNREFSGSYFLAKAQMATPPPRIITPPVSAAVEIGKTLTLRVEASSEEIPTYQWFKDGVMLEGKTDSTLVITNVSANDAGFYAVRITNSGGSKFSEPARLTVWPNIQVTVTTLAGGVRGYRNSRDALLAQFDEPNSLAITRKGLIFVPDAKNHLIRTIAPDGAVQTWAGTPTGREIGGYKDGPAATAFFSVPIAVTLDPAGDLLVADSVNHRIRRVLSVGLKTVSTVAGNGVTALQNGPALNASFNFPNDVVVDRGGNIFVSEFNNHTIRRIRRDGQVSTFAGNGAPGYADGHGSAAQFNKPGGMAIDLAGNLYVTEWASHRVRKIFPDGTVTTIAGTNVAGFKDGYGSDAQFNTPDGIAADAEGNLYVAEYGNSAIRRISPDGLVVTLAGRGTHGFADGDRASAQFNHPGGIAVHPNGRLIVADTGNHRIRVLRVESEPKPTPEAPTIELHLQPGLTIYGVPGTRYRIDYADELTPSNWIAVTNFTLRTPVQRWIDPRPMDQRKRLYRAVIN